jgi:hypothetical protein
LYFGEFIFGDTLAFQMRMPTLRRPLRMRMHDRRPPNVKNALTAWLDLRDAADPTAPLFVSLTSNMVETRISGTGVYLLVRDQLGLRRSYIYRRN